MLLSRRILSEPVVYVSLLLLMLAGVNQAGRSQGENIEHSVTPGEVISHPLQLSGPHILVGDAPSMEVLLLRLQELQALLEIHQGVEAKALSAALFSLSLSIRQTFDGYLFTSYTQLSRAQKESYVGVMTLVLELGEVISQAEGAGPAQQAASM